MREWVGETIRKLALAAQILDGFLTVADELEGGSDSDLGKGALEKKASSVSSSATKIVSICGIKVNLLS